MPHSKIFWDWKSRIFWGWKGEKGRAKEKERRRVQWSGEEKRRVKNAEENRECFDGILFEFRMAMHNFALLVWFFIICVSFSFFFLFGLYFFCLLSICFFSFLFGFLGPVRNAICGENKGHKGEMSCFAEVGSSI